MVRKPDTSGILKQAGSPELDRFFELSCDLFGIGSLETRTWVRVNHAFEAILGWQPEELIGRPFFDIVHPEDQQRARAAEASLLEGRMLRNYEVRMLCRDEGYRWIAWDTVAHMAEGRLFAVGRDATRRRRRLHELRASNSRMQRANEELEQFASSAGHDLEEPLRTLSLYSELLLREQGRGLPENISESLETILRETGKMRALVRALREYGHITQQNANEQRFQPVKLEDVLTDVLRSLEGAIRGCAATITHEGLPEVRGDRVQLARVFQNLLSNSLKYHSKQRRVKIHVGAQDRGQEWLFHVADNGAGFKPDYAERIFAPFKRLHGRDEVPGTGLGLPICRKVLDLHGGRIWAESRAGEGAIFWFTLPR